MENTLEKEIERVSELLKFYEEIPEGFMGASMIKVSLENAKTAVTKKEIKDAIEDLQSIKG